MLRARPRGVGPTETYPWPWRGFATPVVIAARHVLPRAAEACRSCPSLTLCRPRHWSELERVSELTLPQLERRRRRGVTLRNGHHSAWAPAIIAWSVRSQSWRLETMVATEPARSRISWASCKVRGRCARSARNRMNTCRSLMTSVSVSGWTLLRASPLAKVTDAGPDPTRRVAAPRGVCVGADWTQVPIGWASSSQALIRSWQRGLDEASLYAPSSRPRAEYR